MNCPLEFDQRGELIVGYAASTLDSADASAFERHIRSCAACRQEVALQKLVWAALDQWRAVVLASGPRSAC